MVNVIRVFPPDIRIGFVPIARPTFDLDLARAVTAQLYAALQSAGYWLVGSQELVMDGQAIDARIDELKAADIDMILVAQASFADSTMILHLARAIPAPLLMWAFPEDQGLAAGCASIPFAASIWRRMACGGRESATTSATPRLKTRAR